MLASQERAAVRQHYGSARLHAEPKVLADLNLTFPRNQTVALVEGERVRSIHLHAGHRVLAASSKWRFSRTTARIKRAAVGQALGDEVAQCTNDLAVGGCIT